MKSSLTAGVLMITLGLGQLLSAMGVVPEINWVWTMFLAAAGVLVFVLGGVNKATVVLGPFFLFGSILSILRETGKISINVELPMLVILIGILILIAHHPSIPTPAWLLPIQATQFQGMIARSPAPSVAMTSRQVYTSEFWLSYTANTMLVAATALLFRFAEFVKFLKGSEETAGLVIAVGVCASLTLRFFLGQAIDHFGVRRSWITSAVVCTLGSAMFLTVSEIGPLLYISRAVFATGVACCFACSISYIQTLVSENRRTEVIGALGSSGFVGMIIGSNLADIVFLVHDVQGWQLFEILFGATAALAAAYVVMVCVITHGDVHERPRHTPGAHRLLWKYWPGSVVLVALMMGTGISVTTVFLSRFVTVQGLPGIRTFFTGYALTAFIVRIISRSWSRQIGRHRVLLIGLAGHAAGNLLFPLVTAEWHLLFPAIACGIGHALLFPCVVSIGAGAFPPEYRGTGTTMILGFVDLGTILSAPLLGRIIDHHGFTPMFITSASVSLVIMAVYGVLTRNHVCSDQQMFLESNGAAVPEIVAIAACDAGIVGETPATWDHALRVPRRVDRLRSRRAVAKGEYQQLHESHTAHRAEALSAD